LEPFVIFLLNHSQLLSVTRVARNEMKIYQMPTKLLNGHKMYQIAVKYSKWSYNIPSFFIPRPSKIYPNWYFWYENLPSGIPERHSGSTPSRRKFFA
jgi:hypothetical protein